MELVRCILLCTVCETAGTYQVSRCRKRQRLVSLSPETSPSLNPIRLQYPPSSTSLSTFCFAPTLPGLGSLTFGVDLRGSDSTGRTHPMAKLLRLSPARPDVPCFLLDNLGNEFTSIRWTGMPCHRWQGNPVRAEQPT